MIDAYLEFQTENSERRFPFVEDSSLRSTLDDLLRDDAVLDARGFHRERPEIAPQLSSIDGGDSGAVGAVTGLYRVGFKAGRSDAPLFFYFLVPEGNDQWPLNQTSTVADPLYPGSNLGRLNVAFGPGILAVDPSSSLTFDGTALLESSAIAQLYRTQVDFVRLVHQADDDEYVGGDVLILPGYNMEVLVLTDGISLLPSLGAGLGRFVGTLNQTSVCDGTVLSISGQRPTQRGEFFIKGGRGIKVTPIPDEHKIRISVDNPILGAVCE